MPRLLDPRDPKGGTIYQQIYTLSWQKPITKEEYEERLTDSQSGKLRVEPEQIDLTL